MVADDFDFGKAGEPEEESGALVSETVYKGRPVLVLKKTVDDKYPLSFGLGKAKLIVDNQQVIENFVRKHSKE